jgi:hypothetical protein
MTAEKKLYYAVNWPYPDKREMTDNEFREYIEQLVNNGSSISEIPYFRPLVDLKENEEIVYL